MTDIPITGSQIVAARALVEISQKKLASRAKVDLSAVLALERRRNIANAPSLEISRIHAALEELGAVFVPERDGAGVGVHLKFSRRQARAIDAWENEGGAAADDDVP